MECTVVAEALVPVSKHKSYSETQSTDRPRYGTFKSLAIPFHGKSTQNENGTHAPQAWRFKKICKKLLVRIP